MSASEQDLIEFAEISTQWVRVEWKLSRKTLARSESSLGREIYGSQRVLRMYQLDAGETGLPSKTRILQQELPVNVSDWIVRLPSRDLVWEIEIGVMTQKEKFFSYFSTGPISLKKSRTPEVDQAAHLKHSMLLEAIDSGAAPPLSVQNSFVMRGATTRRAQVLIDDQEVTVDPKTGHFEWDLPLTNGRVVVPVNVIDAGFVTRALLAVELNFHRLESEPTEDY